MSKTLFLTLRVFSATGGIEKVCRIMGKALYEESIKNDGVVHICSMYDRQEDAFNNLYFPSENFRGFGINKLHFIKEMVQAASRVDRVILSHINLLLIGWLIKKKAPSIKIILLAHGIEIWHPLSPRKRNMLWHCDAILAVSSFTRNKIIEQHKLLEEKCKVLNNCIDPFLSAPSRHKKNEALLNKYGYSGKDKILLTLTRLSSKERYKGYDKVIRAVAGLLKTYPTIKYLIAGGYDTAEKSFVDSLIQETGLQQNVLMPGYIKEEELEDHFALSDMYVMPSRKEGFGIIFIEAMYYGLPVIAGNQDGSADALLQGRLGQLINPEDVAAISRAIENILEDPFSFTPDRNLLMNHFSYDAYKANLEEVTSSVRIA
ncbi:MAG: glycosyltransferase family 4 protein [Bacteroidota bacterium]|nr:glycosyltransferase family 4 protein [Bacteroidota bacterium]